MVARMSQRPFGLLKLESLVRAEERSPIQKLAVSEPLLIDPVIVDRFSVGVVVRSKGDELEALGAGLEGSRYPGRDAYCVSSPNVEDLGVELYPPVAREDHVDLFPALVAMHEGRPLARVEPEVRQARLLCVQILARDPRLPPVPEAVG
jgi:hypothetical protein